MGDTCRSSTVRVRERVLASTIALSRALRGVFTDVGHQQSADDVAL